MIAYVNPDDTTVATTMAKIKTQMYGLKRDFKLSLHTLATASKALFIKQEMTQYYTYYFLIYSWSLLECIYHILQL
jgi:hypothetical protein